MTACDLCDTQEAIFKCSKCGKVKNQKKTVSIFKSYDFFLENESFVNKSVIFMMVENQQSMIYGKAGQLQDTAQSSHENQSKCKINISLRVHPHVQRKNVKLYITTVGIKNYYTKDLLSVG